jgi:hypothetical protein
MEKLVLKFAEYCESDGHIHMRQWFKKYHPGLDTAKGVTGGDSSPQEQSLHHHCHQYAQEYSDIGDLVKETGNPDRRSHFTRSNVRQSSNSVIYHQHNNKQHRPKYNEENKKHSDPQKQTIERKGFESISVSLSSKSSSHSDDQVVNKGECNTVKHRLRNKGSSHIDVSSSTTDTHIDRFAMTQSASSELGVFTGDHGDSMYANIPDSAYGGMTDEGHFEKPPTTEANINPSTFNQKWDESEEVGKRRSRDRNMESMLASEHWRDKHSSSMSDLENANHQRYKASPIALHHANDESKATKDNKNQVKNKQGHYRRMADIEPYEDNIPYLSSDSHERSDSLEDIIEENVEEQEKSALVEFKKSIAKEMGVVFQKKEQAAQFIAHNSMEPIKRQISRNVSTTRWKMK